MLLSTVTLPEQPLIPSFSHILELWDYTDEAFEVTHFFQALFSRLPPYFLAFFALCFVFIVAPLIIRLATEIL